MVGCEGNSSSRSVQSADPQPSPSVPSLNFDEACEEYNRVAELINKGVVRATEAFRDRNFELGATISLNHIELLTDLGSKGIGDSNLSPLISDFVSTSVEVESHFAGTPEVIDTYGAGSSEAVAYFNDPNLEILLETQNFKRDQIHAMCGLP